MGILDKVASLLPRRGEREQEEPAKRAEALALRDDVDRWLERLLDDPWSLPTAAAPRWMPPVNVQDTGDEVVVTAEVPGLDREDISLTISPQGLIIRGEKREQKEDRRKDAYVSASRSERFVRTVPLPPGLDLDRAEARVSRGVLTVKFPKVDARPGARRIPIAT